MSKSETLMAFEAALKESKELQEKFEAAKKRLCENKEDGDRTELLIKVAAELGFTLTISEVDRAIAQTQELSEEELANIAGGSFNWCMWDYVCIAFYQIDNANWA